LTPLKKEMHNSSVKRVIQIIAAGGFFVLCLYGGYELYEKVWFYQQKQKILRDRSQRDEKSLKVLNDPKSFSEAEVASSMYHLSRQDHPKALEIAKFSQTSESPILYRAAIQVIGAKGKQADLERLIEQFKLDEDEGNQELLLKAILSNPLGPNIIEKSLIELRPKQAILYYSRLLDKDLPQNKQEEGLRQLLETIELNENPLSFMALQALAKKRPTQLEVINEYKSLLKGPDHPAMETAALHLTQTSSEWLKNEMDYFLTKGSEGQKIALLRVIPMLCPKDITQKLINLYQKSEKLPLKMATLRAITAFSFAEKDQFLKSIETEKPLTHEARKKLLSVARQADVSNNCSK
jgi:hypothetical protein